MPDAPKPDASMSMDRPDELPRWAAAALREPVTSRAESRAAIMDAIRREPAHRGRLSRRDLVRFVQSIPTMRAARWPRRGLLTPFGATAMAAVLALAVGMQRTVELIPGYGTRAKVIHFSAQVLGDTVLPGGSRVLGLAFRDTLFRDTLRVVEFVLRGTDVASANVVGDFNGWQPRATPLRRAPDGTWRARVVVPRDQVHFAYVVNDEDEGDDARGALRRPSTAARVRLDSI